MRKLMTTSHGFTRFQKTSEYKALKSLIEGVGGNHLFLKDDLFLNPEDFFLNPEDCEGLPESCLGCFFCLPDFGFTEVCSAALCFLCMSFHVAPISCIISSFEDAPMESDAPALETQSRPSFAKGLDG